jgi:hypothetical protein
VFTADRRIAIGAGAVAAVDKGLYFPSGANSLAVVAGGAAVSVNYDPTTGAMGPSVSSRRFKTNIRSLASDTSKLFDLRPVTFEYKATDVTDFGYLAEDVNEVLPELVPRDAEGRPLAVNYDRITVMLVEELRKTRDSLANALSDIAALKAKIL